MNSSSLMRGVPFVLSPHQKVELPVTAHNPIRVRQHCRNRHDAPAAKGSAQTISEAC
jgi:hypothetical protein